MTVRVFDPCSVRSRKWLVVFDGYLYDVHIVSRLAGVNAICTPYKSRREQKDGKWFTWVYFSLLVPRRWDYMKALFPDATVEVIRGGFAYGEEEK